MYAPHGTANDLGYSYDAAGNLTGDGTAAYGYDALGRMIVRGTTPYTYTGDGVLVDDGTTRYTQDLAAPLTQILQTTQISTTNYLYGLDRLAAQTGSATTSYVGDALGSVRMTLDDAGVPLGVVNYDPWGTPESGSVPTFGFTGELQDAATGLVNLRARWYATGQGRFVNRDPFAGVMERPYSQHQYQYGYSDPISNTDPSGKAVIFLAYRNAFQSQYHVAIILDDNSIAGCSKPRDGVAYHPCNGQTATIIQAGPEISNDQLSPTDLVLGFLQCKNSWGRIEVRPGTRPGSRGSDIGSGELADPFYTGTKKIIVDDNKPVSHYTSLMFPYILRVEQANIAYHPLFRNSNSVASGAIQAAGISINVNHPYPVPGWGKNVFPVDLSEYGPIFPITVRNTHVT